MPNESREVERASVYLLDEREYHRFLRSRSHDGFHGTSIGGSDIAAIMGASPFSRAGDVYDRILGIQGIQHSNAAMRRGVANESLILERFRLHLQSLSHPLACTLTPSPPTIYTYLVAEQLSRPDTPPQVLARASLDAQLRYPVEFSEEFAVVEIKSMGAASFARIGANTAPMCGIPLHYYMQVQWYLAVTQFGGGAYFVAEGPDLDAPLCVRHVTYDETLVGQMFAAAREFWATCILTRTRPTAERNQRARRRPLATSLASLPPIRPLTPTPEIAMPQDTPAAEGVSLVTLAEAAYFAKQVKDLATADHERAVATLKAAMELNGITEVRTTACIARISESSRTTTDYAAYRADHPTLDLTRYERRTATLALRFTDVTQSSE